MIIYKSFYNIDIRNSSIKEIVALYHFWLKEKIYQAAVMS